jgi:hypothetical protein
MAHLPRIEKHRVVRTGAPPPRPFTLVALGAAMIFSARGLGAQDGVVSDRQPAETLHGTVLNRLTQEPVGRALVYSPDNRFATMTDDRGNFQFEFHRVEPKTPAGTAAAGGPGVLAYTFGSVTQSVDRPYQLGARKNGYLFDPNDNNMVSVDPQQNEVTLFVVPEARIVGRVLLPEAENPAGMLVHLYQRQVRDGEAHWEEHGGPGQARSNGEFRFANLPAGSYKIFTEEFLDRDPVTSDPRGQLFGYPPVFYPGAADFASAAVIRLEAGETFQASVSPAKREYYAVKLGIANVNPGIQPEVRVWRQGHEGPGYSLGYDFREGKISGLLPNGVYAVELTSRGPDTLIGTANITVGGGPASGVVTLLPSASVSIVVNEEFQQARPGYIGSISDESGHSFTVSSRRPSYLQIRLVPVDEFGVKQPIFPRQPSGPEDASLVFEGVPPGQYKVRAEATFGYVSAIGSGGSDLQRLPLQISSGSAPPPIEVTVRDDGAGVDGTVMAPGARDSQRATGRADTPGSGGIVYFVPTSNGGQPKEAWISADGSFRMQQLPPGDYRVMAFEHKPSEFQYANEEWMSRYDAKSQVISLLAAQTQHLRVPLIMGSE